MFKPERYEFKETVMLPGKGSSIAAIAKDFDVEESGSWLIFTSKVEGLQTAAKVHVGNIRYIFGVTVDEAPPRLVPDPVKITKTPKKKL